MSRIVRAKLTGCGLCGAAILVAAYGLNLLAPSSCAEEPSTGGLQSEADPQPPGPAPAAAPEPAVLLAQNTTQAAGGLATAARQAGDVERATDAERVTGLQRAIEADQQALQKVQADLADPASEYHQAEAEFKQSSARLEELKKAWQQAGDDGNRDEAARLQSEIDKLQPQWQLAKERFELAIQQRKTILEKVATLKQKLQQDQGTLEKLMGVAPEQSAPAEPPAGPAVASDQAPAVAESAAATTATPPAAAPTTPASLLNGLSAVPALTPPSPETAPAAVNPPQTEKPASKELVKATDDALKKEAAAQVAEKEVQSVVERMELLRKDIELELQLLATTRKQADVALQTERQLQEQYQNKLREGTDPAGIEELRGKVAQAQQRFTEARSQARERVNRLDELQSRYATLQSEQIIALQEAERTRLEAETAQKTVAALRNPFTARNILQWLIDHSPRIVAILLAIAAALWLTRVAERRIIDMMVKRGGLGKMVDRENRARTLVGVFHNAANVAIVSGGALMLLDTIGAPVTALMGGAAVIGLAVAFGAQSLIKDFFYGFMILLEQQYTINDVIRIGDISGQVERITLRMTVLRDLEGRVHFIPHGTITSTTNMTHGWSRALFEIGVAYKEDADRVIALIKQLGQEMRQDSTYAPLILDDLNMLGVDAFGDSAVVIKFYIKTRPLKQWEVKRELLRRIKKTFDEQGIEIPFPHRTVYHRHVDAEELDMAANTEIRRRKSA